MRHGRVGGTGHLPHLHTALNQSDCTLASWIRACVVPELLLQESSGCTRSHQPPPLGLTRSYLNKNYDELKMLNPGTPFLMRDNYPNKPPKLIVTYGKAGPNQRDVAAHALHLDYF
jgi:hypothetical protein